MAYIVGVLLFIFLGVGGYASYVTLENSRLEIELYKTNEALKAQNKAIEEMALDTEGYACSLDSLNNYAASKYKKVKGEHELDTCEKKLEEFEKLLGIYDKE